MGIFDFIKKIFEDEKAEVGKEKMGFFDIKNWIEKKSKENEIREKQTLNLIKNKIEVFSNDIKTKIKVLEDVDVELKKAEDKLKFMTNEGRKKYIEFANIFINNLESLKKDDIEVFIASVNKAFSSFNKSSRMSYERATILIGKEVADIKEDIKALFQELKTLIEKNKDIIDFSKTISLVKSNLEEINRIERDIEIIRADKILIDNKIKQAKEKEKKILGEIEEIKKSPYYLENIERQNKIKLLNGEMEKDISKLREMINFKGLSNFYHIFENQMSIVKLHREDFLTNFNKDDGASILSLLHEAKLDNENILKIAEEMENKKRKIQTEKEQIKKDETQNLYSETTKILLEIGNLNNEKTRDEKREEKIKEKKVKLIEEIKENIKKIGGEVE